MRAAVIAILLALAPGARAQDFDTMVRTQQLEAAIANIRQRDVALSNELMAMEARAQAEHSISALQAQRNSPGNRPPVDYEALDRAPVVPRSYATIPDERLAASNARVKAAAENRR